MLMNWKDANPGGIARSIMGLTERPRRKMLHEGAQRRKSTSQGCDGIQYLVDVYVIHRLCRWILAKYREFTSIRSSIFIWDQSWRSDFMYVHVKLLAEEAGICSLHTVLLLSYSAQEYVDDIQDGLLDAIPPYMRISVS